MTVTERKRASVSLPSDDQILITRSFDAPKHLVYRAWTTPELVQRWWCGQRGVVTCCEIDLRVGGRWRYVLRANAGFDVRVPRCLPGDRARRPDRLDRGLRSDARQ